MATFNFSETITDSNETQMFITRTILGQKGPFTTSSIFKAVSKRCYYAESFKVTNMVLDTLDHLVERGELYECSGVYWVS